MLRKRWKDDPDIIKARLIVVGIMTDKLSWVAHFVGDSDNLSIKLLLIRISQLTLVRLGWFLDISLPNQLHPYSTLARYVFFIFQKLSHSNRIEYNARHLFMSLQSVRSLSS